MALFNECMPQCAQKVFDTADIVRDGILRQLWSPTQANIFRNCSILNRRSIASVGMISESRLRGRAVQQTSQLERVWGVLFGAKVYNRVSPTSSGITPMPRIFKKCAMLSRLPMRHGVS